MSEGFVSDERGSPVQNFRVDPAEAGERVDRLAARRLGISRSLVQRLIEENLLLVDGEETYPSYRVRGGQRVEARVPEEDLSPEEIPVPVLFEDEHVLVVDKPAGLVVHPGAGNPSGTLVNALLNRGIEGGDDPLRPGVVHRLDRDTSGLMVLAKGEPAYSRLVGMLSARRVGRVYRAIVEGEGLPRTGTIDSPVGRDPDNPTLMAAGVGKPAVTHFEVLAARSRTYDAARTARDGKDAPDQGPPLGHRASRLRGPPVRLPGPWPSSLAARRAALLRTSCKWGGARVSL